MTGGHCQGPYATKLPCRMVLRMMFEVCRDRTPVMVAVHASDYDACVTHYLSSAVAQLACTTFVPYRIAKMIVLG